MEEHSPGPVQASAPDHRAAADPEFDSLLAEVIARFVSLHGDAVDEAIQDALRRVSEALHLDRGSIFLLSEDRQDLLLTHSWSRPDLPPPQASISAASQYPWTLPKVLAGETVVVGSREEMPHPLERATMAGYLTTARVTYPLRLDGHVAGAINFSSVAPRSWEPAVLERLRLVGQVFGAALARKRADAVLRESEHRFRAIADNAPALIWMSGPDKLCTWFNRQWLEFVGQPIEHELGVGWTAHVHPDDLRACLTTYESHFDLRRPFRMEYRLRRHDGEWRWILDTGAAHEVGGMFSGYVGTCIDITEQKRAVAELERLRDELRVENVNLRREVLDRGGARNVVAESEAMRLVMAQVGQVAATDSTVLLLGETGTGKELLATRIHELSTRRGRTMVRVNCAAIPPTLIESELFGREKGAFTGALARQLGRFELADRSTIFLDEVGDLPLEVQVKLLRVLEERQIERLGSPKPIRVDVRIIAATHRNLELGVAQGRFREDLFYRLNVFPISIPPLRERPADIPQLVWRFVVEFSRTLGKRIDSIPDQTMTSLQEYDWPGNIRELRNVIERSMILAHGNRLTIAVPARPQTAARAARSRKLVDVEMDHIRATLESSGWRIRGADGAAERLGLRPTTLETRMAKLGLTRPKP